MPVSESNDVLAAARRHFNCPPDMDLAFAAGGWIPLMHFYAGAAWGASQRMTVEDLKALAAELAKLPGQ